MSQATTGDTPLLRENDFGTAVGGAQVIRSPEQVALDLQLAGPMSRLLAFSLDYAFILLIGTVIATALLLAALSIAGLEQQEQVGVWVEELQVNIESGDFEFGPVFLLLLAAWIAIDFVLQLAYFVASELLMQGRSPGKAAIGLRVVREGGLPLTLRESLLRNLLRMVDMLPSHYFVGFVSMVLSKDVRRLGDYAAGTLVIRDERSAPARPIDVGHGPAPGKLAFRFEADQIAAIGPVELRLVRQTLRRLDELPSWKGKQVLGRTSQAICRRIGWGEPLEPEHQREFLLALLRDAEGR